MLQQILALAIIIFFVGRLGRQYKKQQINKKELSIWLIFWGLAAAAIIFIHVIDRLVAKLGFSGTAINILVYLVIVALIYQVFRLRLAIARLEKDLSRINQYLTLKK
jgi:hypothetical protein